MRRNESCPGRQPRAMIAGVIGLVLVIIPLLTPVAAADQGLAAGAGLVMAAECGAPIVNYFLCAGAVTAYVQALAQVAEECNTANW